MPSYAKLWWLVCVIFLAACSGTPELTPTQEVIRVGVSPDLVGLVADPIQEYQSVESASRLKLVTLTPSEADAKLLDGEIDLMIGVHAAEAAEFTTPLASEGIAIITNSAVNVRDFELAELVAVFSGNSTDWEELGGPAGEIQPVILQVGSETRDALSAALPQLRYSTAALLAPHPTAMMEIVQAEPGAIGFLPAGSVSEGVGIGAVDGVRPSPTRVHSGEYPLTMAIQAYALDEPTGAARDFLVWWQSR